MARRGRRRRVGGWLIALIVAGGVIAAQSIQDHGYTDPNDFFEEILEIVINWSWVVFVLLFLYWWFIQRHRVEKKWED